VLLSNFMTKHLLDREAHVTMDFVLNVLRADGSVGYLADPGNPELASRFESSIRHFTSVPDVQRINVYARNHTVLWSTDPQLIGQRFDQNDELDEALHGELAVEGGSISDSQRSKPEHVGLSAESAFFVETYIPIRSSEQPEVLGVFEIYKAPVALTAAIRDGHRQIWLTAFLGALALYLTLFWIVRSADRKIHDQNERLLKAETMAAVGELAASVAHNIRNPLASIRSSAELALEMTSSPSGEQARDIMASVDRIEEWLRDLVSFAHVDSVPRARVDAAQLMQHCFTKLAHEFKRFGVHGEVAAAAQTANVNADRALLGHVLHILVANAIEATAQDGRVTGQVTTAGGKVEFRIADTGRGIAPEHLGKLFSLFFTTKPRGLGIGLTLAHRAIERFGGTIRVDSTLGTGTVFTIELPTA
jgi:two-component system sensor histidine kinase HydH